MYNSTDFDGSLRVLHALPVKDGAAYELIGRNYYMQGDYKQAVDALERAFQSDSANSSYALWLGRAYGRRAENAGPFTAPGYASKTRQYFERAVQLDPRNVEAMNDLFEYYFEAPGFLGGGSDKAAALALRIGQVSPADGDVAVARLAEKNKDYRSAEASLRRAVEAAPAQMSRLIDLARFLMRRGRDQEAEQAFAQAEKVAPGNPKLLYERAESYIRNGRNIELAHELLRRYLKSSITADDPPRADAAKLLAR
ncbi:MAG TPA: tetratricopeptide repeat protein [Bryobacteraceae bacterium]|nr:tetratricopeptide repeat protein [Bryobacteraceae bacterium]